VVTPDLRFDQDGFLDLSVFPDTEPDVYGHSPAGLDPLLAEDQRELVAAVDDAWLAEVVAGLGAHTGRDERDERLAFLVPHAIEPTAGSPEGHAAIASGGDDHADDDGEDIEIASLLLSFSNREGSAGEGSAS